MTQWSQYLYTTIVWSAKWPLWLAPGCLAQKYLWSLVFPALNRTSYRSAEESSLGFCLQVSWVAQIRLDFPQICKPIFLQSLQRKEKKKKGKVLRVQYEQGRVSPRAQTLDTCPCWQWSGPPGGLQKAWSIASACRLMCSHCLHHVTMTLRGSVITWATHSRILCTTVLQKSPDMGKSGLTEIKDFGIA